MKKWLLMSLLATSLLTGVAMADPGPPPHGPHGSGGMGPGGPGGHGGPGGEQRRAQMQQRMKEMRAQLLRREAGLDEASAQKAEKVLDGFDADRQKGHRDVGEARRGLADLAQSDSKDEGAYKKALDALIAANRAQQDLRSRELDELRKVLSQRETAKVLLSLERMQQMMRQEMKKARKAWLKAELDRMEGEDGDDPPPPGPPPPPPPPPRKGGQK
ncbi:MAG: hypothetical protein HY902_12140 [Deltaproteobacteria bacterium]|nr:hypothetical protein [Deltaproteobacteria bacterium]